MTFVDLFAGAGGFSLGFMQAGAKCLAALDYELAAVKTYWRNLCLDGWSHLWVDPADETMYKKVQKYFKDSTTDNRLFEIPADDWLQRENEVSPALNLFCMDITTLDAAEFCRLGGFKPGDVDVIVGGPPCQGYSTSNVQRRMNGYKAMDDPRNELVFHFIRYCRDIKPKMFLMENVPGLLSLGKKPGDKDGPVPQSIIAAAKIAGYHCEYHVHDAKDYGVPQHRERVIFQGIRQDLYDAGMRHTTPERTHTWSMKDHIEENQHSLFPNEYPAGQPYCDVMEAIGDLGDIKCPAAKEWKHLPIGDFGRLKEGGEMIRYAGHTFQEDRLTDLWVCTGEINSMLKTSKNKELYKICNHCGAYNLKVRTECQRCRETFTSLLLL